MAEKHNKDEDYLKKLDKNKEAADERTAKRRKKREKLKQKKLMAKKAKLEAKNINAGDGDESSESSDDSDEKEEEREAEDDAEAPSFIMGKKWLDRDMFVVMDTRITEQIPTGIILLGKETQSTGFWRAAVKSERLFINAQQ